MDSGPYSRQQRRMLEVWERLTSRFGSAPDDWTKRPAASERAKRYLSEVKRLRGRIPVTGLGPAIAALRRADAKNAGYGVRQDVEGLTLKLLPLGGGDLMERLRAPDTGTGLRLALTREALAVCDWLARYLEGAGVEPEEEESEPTELRAGEVESAAADEGFPRQEGEAP